MKYMNNEDSEAETRSFSEGFSMEQASFRGSASQRLRAWAPPFASSWSTSSSASFPTSEAWETPPIYFQLILQVHPSFVFFCTFVL